MLTELLKAFKSQFDEFENLKLLKEVGSFSKNLYNVAP